LRGAQDFLALAVIAQGAGLEHRWQADARHCGVQVCLGQDVGERGGGDPQVTEHAFLEQAVTGDAQGLGTWVHRHELRKKRHGLGRNALELEGNQVNLIGQLTQVFLVAIARAQVLAQRGGTGIGRRVEEGEVHAQRSTRQC